VYLDNILRHAKEGIMLSWADRDTLEFIVVFCFLPNVNVNITFDPR
jgi:hypothetical protein